MVDKNTGELTMTIPATLAQKIGKTIQAIHPVGKGGFNEMQRYHYATEADVIEATRPAFVENGLILLVDTLSEELIPVAPTKSGTQQFITKLMLQYTIVDSETGNYIQLRQAGHGMDTGDKGIYKAYTGANKYFLMKLCQIATTDDPENGGKKPNTTKPKTTSQTEAPPGNVPIPNPASEAQIDKINKFIVEKEMPEQLAKELQGWLSGEQKSSGKAGIWIAKLLALPNKAGIPMTRKG